MTPSRIVAPSLAELIARASGLATPGERRILGIAGPPGAGKSTLALAVCEALAGRAVLVPMDGFHRSNEELVTLGLRDRKGAPETFDADGFVALLAAVHAGDAVRAPAPGRHGLARQARRPVRFSRRRRGPPEPPGRSGRPPP